MSIKFNNPHIALGKNEIRFTGEKGKEVIICSIERSALASYAKLSNLATDADIAKAFDQHRELIIAVAAAQWRSGYDRPRLIYEDLVSYPSGTAHSR